MKKFCLFFAVAWCFSAVAGIAPFSVNVKNFGAKGDGTTDDTAAIQKAVDSCSVDFFENQRGIYSYPWDCPIPEIVFPEGVYKIFNTILIQTFAVLRSEGRAVIKQADSGKDIFYMEHARRIRVDGLEFDGGRRQIFHWTRNADAAQLSVSNCTFRNAAETGIHSRGIRYPLPNGKFGNTQSGPGPYEVTKTGDGNLIFKERDSKKSIGNPNSTLIFVDKCLFFDCARALEISSDGVNIRDCRVETPVNMKGGALLIGGTTSIQGLKGFVRRDTNIRQGLIELRNSSVALDVYDCELETDSAAGAPFIISSAIPHSWFASVLLLKNIKTHSSGCPENAVVFFTGDTCPNILAMTGITETGKGCPSACSWEKCPSIEQLDSNLKNRSHLPYLGINRSYGFSFGGLSANIKAAIPKHLERFLVPYPATIPEPVCPVFPVFPGKVFYADDVGKGGDDTAKLKKIFAAASASENSIVVLPGRRINISETIDITGDMHVTGAGRPVIFMKDYSKDHFHVAATGKNVMFSQISFRYGKSAVVVKDADKHKFGLFFDNCNFLENLGTSIIAEVPENNNGLTIYLKNGIAFVPELYKGNAGLAAFDTFWYCVYVNGTILPKMFHPQGKAHSLTTMTNFANTLYLKNMLGVPITLCRQEAIPNGPEIHGNYRWIDNYGKVYARNVRFGAEGGGMTPVYNFGPKTQVYMEAGLYGYTNPRIKKTPVLTTSGKADLRMFFVGTSAKPYMKDNFFVRDSDGTIGRLENSNMALNYPLR